MEYLLIMALSGSTMTVIYLVLRCLFKDKVSTRLYYLLARVTVLYYLIPLPFLKGWYRGAFGRIMPKSQTVVGQIPLTLADYTVSAGNKMNTGTYGAIQTAVGVVWLLAACLRMAGMVMDYVRTSRLIVRCADKSLTESQRTFLDGIKMRYGVRQDVILSRGYAGAHTMTFGILRPVIICDKALDSREAQLLVCHEMVHIKRWDLLWKMLMQFAAILHWWNPLMWKLKHDFECVCECSCDETVMQGKAEQEIGEYRALLAREALAQRKNKEIPLRWKTGFLDNENEIHERIHNLTNLKKWNCFAAGALVAALTFANSMTVFAYRDAIDPLEVTEICYDKQFTDEEGNVYLVPKKVPLTVYRAGYIHSYVSGTMLIHDRKSDGSCEGIEYRADRCSVCGNLAMGKEISYETYDVCPH